MKTFRGNVREVPPGMEKVEWAQQVWTIQDQLGVDQVEAKRILAERLRRERGN